MIFSVLPVIIVGQWAITVVAKPFSAGKVVPAWTRQTPIRAIPNTNLNDIFCFASNNCWAVGNNSGGETILLGERACFGLVNPLQFIPNVNLNSVSCLSANNCWIVGVNSARRGFTPLARRARIG